ncbi:MAG TPA: proton-conducting transporter membrane subunit [Gammaproteobacteria bacterium]|nr:proton-conducting transporter membrane subunit [Gammaproteobacteria bacterium]
MSDVLLLITFSCWALACLLVLCSSALKLARLLLAAGALAGVMLAFFTLPGGMLPVQLSMNVGGSPVIFALSPSALWLMVFGLAAALPACWLGTPGEGKRGWIAGAALSLLGALGVFGFQDSIAFLIAWEVMSLGGAVMILGGRNAHGGGRRVLFMLSLLEVGSVALLFAFLLMGTLGIDGFNFQDSAVSIAALAPWLQALVGVLLLIGFGAKLGILPFYEWFPAAYGAGSGVSGNLMSGVILNAAFFGLSRGFTQWLSDTSVLFGLGILLIAAGVVSAILAALYAFQEEDWRELLSLSTAENAGIAVTALGAAALFRAQGQVELAGLAWVVAMLQLAAHALAKGGLFIAADGVFNATGSYLIAQRGLLRRSSWLFGIGAVFAGMSLAAMPPQAGFVSEWYIFQTLFQGFHLSSLAGRLVMALAGAGLALTAAISFATFVKVLGVGLLGQGDSQAKMIPWRISFATGILGMAVLALAVGMPWWLQTLDTASIQLFGMHVASAMHDGLILVPLTSSFAFISPTMLVIVCPSLALLAIALLIPAKRFGVRRAAVWFGGLPRENHRVATTSLTFSNAMRTFYSFIYRPTLDVEHEHVSQKYFLKRLQFNYRVAPIFGALLFLPITRLINHAAERLRALQSGNLNFYLALIGMILVLIFILGSL